MAPTTESRGSCLCGDVTYAVRGPLRDVVYCHCGQCRRTSGHFVAATAAETADFEIVEDRGLEWYRSSEIAERGFCKRCGSSLFWRPAHGGYIAVMAGTLDVPTGLRSREHIYTGHASDYYELTDGLPQFPDDHADPWGEEEA